MAEITITVPNGLRAQVEAAWGGTLEDHVQARMDPVFERWGTEAPAVTKKARLDKYDRLDKAKQGQVDAILATAPEPIEEEGEAIPKGL